MEVATAAEPHGSPGPGLDPKRCAARSKQTGKQCGNAAGKGTDHVGIGNCRNHGGATPVKTGRYSSVKHEQLRGLIELHEADPDPLNIFPELAAARALFQDFIERYGPWREAILAWHASWEKSRPPIPLDRVYALGAALDEYENLLNETGVPTPKQRDDLKIGRETVDAMTEPVDTKPREVLDISDAYRIVSEITKIVERIERIRSANAISRADLTRMLREMYRGLELFVTDTATRDQVTAYWRGITGS